MGAEGFSLWRERDSKKLLYKREKLSNRLVLNSSKTGEKTGIRIFLLGGKDLSLPNLRGFEITRRSRLGIKKFFLRVKKVRLQ